MPDYPGSHKFLPEAKAGESRHWSFPEKKKSPFLPPEAQPPGEHRKLRVLFPHQCPPGPSPRTTGLLSTYCVLSLRPAGQSRGRPGVLSNVIPSAPTSWVPSPRFLRLPRRPAQTKNAEGNGFFTIPLHPPFREGLQESLRVQVTEEEKTKTISPRAVSWKESSRTWEQAPHSLPHVIKSSVRSTSVLAEIQVPATPHVPGHSLCSGGRGGVPSTHLAPQRVSARQRPPGWAGTCVHRPSPQQTFHGVTRSPAPVTFPDVTSAPHLLPRGSRSRDFSQVLKKQSRARWRPWVTGRAARRQASWVHPLLYRVLKQTQRLPSPPHSHSPWCTQLSHSRPATAPAADPHPGTVHCCPKGPAPVTGGRTGGRGARRAVHVNSSTPLHPRLHPHPHSHPTFPLSLPSTGRPSLPLRKPLSTLDLRETSRDLPLAKPKCLGLRPPRTPKGIDDC